MQNVLSVAPSALLILFVLGAFGYGWLWGTPLEQEVIDESDAVVHPLSDAGATARMTAGFGDPRVALEGKYIPPTREQVEEIVFSIKGKPNTYELVDTAGYGTIFYEDGNYYASNPDVTDSALVRFDEKAALHILIPSIRERVGFRAWNEYATIHATPASQPDIVYLCVGLLEGSDATYGMCPIMRYDTERDEHRFIRASWDAWDTVPRPGYEYQEAGVLDYDSARDLVLFDYDANATTTLITLPTGETLAQGRECFGGDPYINIKWFDSVTLEYNVYKEPEQESVFCDTDNLLLERRRVQVDIP